MAGRVGSDKFAIVLHGTDEAGAKVMFEAFRGFLQQEMKIQGWSISFSIGVATFSSTRSNLEDALKTADALLSQIKTSVNNNIVFGGYPVK